MWDQVNRLFLFMAGQLVIKCLNINLANSLNTVIVVLVLTCEAMESQINLGVITLMANLQMISKKFSALLILKMQPYAVSPWVALSLFVTWQNIVVIV